MLRIFISCIAVFIIAVVMSMTGRGGGNFYVPLLIASGTPMLEAATIGQLILTATAVSAMLIFHKHKTVDWKLALVIDPPTDIMAFVGGYFAHQFGSTILKFIFSGLLLFASFFMLRSVQEKPALEKRQFGYWRREYGGYKYVVNLWLAIPITAVTGLFAGMIGISGGSFKIPLMVLACGVPMRIAVGTSSAMVAATAFMGFFGHTLSGDLNITRAIPLVIVAVAGGIAGGKYSVKIMPEKLKKIFAYTTLCAALFMVLNAILSIIDPGNSF